MPRASSFVLHEIVAPWDTPCATTLVMAGALTSTVAPVAMRLFIFASVKGPTRPTAGRP